MGEHAIFESAVICEYLEDTIGPALHPAEPLRRAQHRAWIEFASVTLNSIWSFYTARDEAAFQSSAKALTERFAQLEKALSDRPYFSGNRFSLVDAAFAPVFRYFDVFDKVLDVDLFGAAPKTRAWRRALTQRPSVQSAVAADYGARLQQFVIGQDGILGMRLAKSMRDHG